VNRRNAPASRRSSSAAVAAALSVFLLFSGPIADCCPLALMVSAQTEHGCCLEDEIAPATVTTATADAIPDRVFTAWQALGDDEHGGSSVERRADPLSVLKLPPARAVLTVRLRI
jgi:hypothetical protein